jgi:hypothetical protein
MPPAGFEPAVPENEWPQTDALGRGYIRARADTIQQTNICLVIHRPSHVGLRPLAFWDYRLESRRGHEYLSLVSAVCCQAEVSASG